MLPGRLLITPRAFVDADWPTPSLFSDEVFVAINRQNILRFPWIMWAYSAPALPGTQHIKACSALRVCFCLVYNIKSVHARMSPLNHIVCYLR